MKHDSRSIVRLLSQVAQREVTSHYTCRNCLSQRAVSSTSRPYSTSKVPLTPPPSSGFTALSTRRLISLSGPDAAHFLQGVVTPNITPKASRAGGSAPSTPRRGFYGAFLNAQGRLIYDVFIYADLTNGRQPGESWLVEVDAEQAEKLYKHIRKYKLRSKFELKLLPAEELGVWSIWSEGQEEGVIGYSGDVVGCEDSRAPGMGRRVILASGKRPEVDMEGSSEMAYKIRRYLKGVAEGQQELIQESALPQESNIDYMGGLDYRKGCYVGQELTIRTKHTGVVRKRILPVMLYGEEEQMPSSLELKEAHTGVYAQDIPHGTSIGRVGKRGRSAGKFLAGVGNVGLGLCRLEIMTSSSVGGEPSGYKEGDEFKLEWEGDTGNPGTVKIKAFVPDWHVDK